jgi:hypothetical protein
LELLKKELYGGLGLELVSRSSRIIGYPELMHQNFMGEEGTQDNVGFRN